MQQFRRSLTAREGSGVPLFLDRVLLGWLTSIESSLPVLIGEDLIAVAGLCARATHNGRPLFRDFERPDRVFLSRALNTRWQPDSSAALLSFLRQACRNEGVTPANCGGRLGC